MHRNVGIEIVPNSDFLGWLTRSETPAHGVVIDWEKDIFELEDWPPLSADEGCWGEAGCEVWGVLNVSYYGVVVCVRAYQIPIAPVLDILDTKRSISVLDITSRTSSPQKLQEGRKKLVGFHLREFAALKSQALEPFKRSENISRSSTEELTRLEAQCHRMVGNLDLESDFERIAADGRASAAHGYMPISNTEVERRGKRISEVIDIVVITDEAETRGWGDAEGHSGRSQARRRGHGQEDVSIREAPGGRSLFKEE